MKMFAIATLLTISACGPDECKKYIETFCKKSEVCSMVDYAHCLDVGDRYVLAFDHDQQQCADAGESIAGMTCTEFRQRFNL